MTVKSLAVLNKSYRMRGPYEMKKEQTRLFRQLPSGLNMEVIEQKGLVFTDKKIIETQETAKRTHLWFLFMELSSARCWDEHWLPFFSWFGFDCYSVSLLGQVTRSFALRLFKQIFHSVRKHSSHQRWRIIW
ncbi:PREDICTED: uncharacterized protein LOC105123378 [Populus euphratica]|uniref:Uncharacterized protein LOC105123378 n=1 Tax=Populus euphratica TaxID=75702 RepID=A0AAJ6XJH1_POPEU|nr:PREDICTED: uncharacterized protein LOC105123378 [Populus euphratica]